MATKRKRPRAREAKQPSLEPIFSYLARIVPLALTRRIILEVLSFYASDDPSMIDPQVAAIAPVAEQALSLQGLREELRRLVWGSALYGTTVVERVPRLGERIILTQRDGRGRIVAQTRWYGEDPDEEQIQRSLSETRMWLAEQSIILSNDIQSGPKLEQAERFIRDALGSPAKEAEAILSFALQETLDRYLQEPVGAQKPRLEREGVDLPALAKALAPYVPQKQLESALTKAWMHYTDGILEWDREAAEALAAQYARLSLESRAVSIDHGYWRDTKDNGPTSQRMTRTFVEELGSVSVRRF